MCLVIFLILPFNQNNCLRGFSLDHIYKKWKNESSFLEKKIIFSNCFNDKRNDWEEKIHSLEKETMITTSCFSHPFCLFLWFNRISVFKLTHYTLKQDISSLLLLSKHSFIWTSLERLSLNRLQELFWRQQECLNVQVLSNAIQPALHRDWNLSTSMTS